MLNKEKLSLNTREQRLRKHAELQSLWAALTNLRLREASYIENSVEIPALLLAQINKTQQEILEAVSALAGLKDQTVQSPAFRVYRLAVEEELAGNLAKAAKLYRSAARHNHPDGRAALQSGRYRLKSSNNGGWATALFRLPGVLWLISLAATLIFGVAAVPALVRYPPRQEPFAINIEATARPTPPLVAVVAPDTPTPTGTTTTPTATPLPTHTATPAPTATPVPPPTQIVPTILPTPTLALKAAPKIIGPPDGVVWKDGAIVFEFEKLNLARDELYCLETLRGYDQTLTEMWSFPPVGDTRPAIPIKADVFHIAKAQGIQCVAWSAYLGRGSCDTIISHSTETRIIGLPHPCPLATVLP